MTPWLAAHLRLCAKLPSRTHYRDYQEMPSWGQRYKNGILPQDLIADYKALKAAGRTYKQIRNELRVGPHTMTKLAALAVAA